MGCTSSHLAARGAPGPSGPMVRHPRRRLTAKERERFLKEAYASRYENSTLSVAMDPAAGADFEFGMEDLTADATGDSSRAEEKAKRSFRHSGSRRRRSRHSGKRRRQRTNRYVYSSSEDEDGDRDQDSEEGRLDAGGDDLSRHDRHSSSRSRSSRRRGSRRSSSRYSGSRRSARRSRSSRSKPQAPSSESDSDEHWIAAPLSTDVATAWRDDGASLSSALGSGE